jgi:hypothetical protein
MASVEITVTPTPPPGVEQYLTSAEGGITIILGLVGIGGFLYGAYKITRGEKRLGALYSLLGLIIMLFAIIFYRCLV